MSIRFRHLLAVVVSSTVGCEKPCEVPGGEYDFTYTKLEGDCPEEVVERFDGHTSPIQIDGGECRSFGFQHTSKLPNGCELDTSMSALLTAEGPTSGQTVVALRCTKPEPFTCQHLFSVEYKRKP